MNYARMTLRQAMVAAAASLLWHLVNEDGQHLTEINLRCALRAYIDRYKED
jgi:hypothetical protein